jgi:hypothetical protein
MIGLTKSWPRLCGREWTILTITVLLGAALRVLFFIGFIGSDDTDYLKAAVRLAQHFEWSPTNVRVDRIGFVGATAGLIWVFGLTEFVIVSISLWASLATHVLVYALAKVCYREAGVGLVAAALLAFYPLNVLHATTLVPESLLSCAMAGALLVYTLSLRAEGAKRLVLSLLAGAAIGIGYLIKEPGALLLGAVGVTWIAPLIRQRRIQLAWVALIVGFVAVLAMEALLLYLAAGTAAVRLDSGAQAGGRAPQFPWYLYLRWMFASFYSVGVLFYLMVAALLWSCAHRIRLPALLVAWLVVVLGYMTFGSVSLRTYVPPAQQPRYLEAVTVPVVLLTAGVVVGVFRTGGVTKRALVVAALGGYGIVGLLCMQLTSAVERWKFEPVRVVESDLKRNRMVPLYASTRLANGLFQLSGAGWRPRYLEASTCGGHTQSWSVLVVPEAEAGVTRVTPAPECVGWVLWRRIEIRPPVAISGGLRMVRAGLDLSPMPQGIRDKMLGTIERHAAMREVNLLIPVSEDAVRE